MRTSVPSSAGRAATSRLCRHPASMDANPASTCSSRPPSRWSGQSHRRWVTSDGVCTSATRTPAPRAWIIPAGRWITSPGRAGTARSRSSRSSVPIAARTSSSVTPSATPSRFTASGSASSTTHDSVLWRTASSERGGWTCTDSISAASSVLTSRGKRSSTGRASPSKPARSSAMRSPSDRPSAGPPMTRLTGSSTVVASVGRSATSHDSPVGVVASSWRPSACSRCPPHGLGTSTGSRTSGTFSMPAILGGSDGRPPPAGPFACPWRSLPVASGGTCRMAVEGGVRRPA